MVSLYQKKVIFKSALKNTGIMEEMSVPSTDTFKKHTLGVWFATTLYTENMSAMKSILLLVSQLNKNPL